MKKTVALILCIILLALTLNACTVPFIGKKNSGGNENGGSSGGNSSDIQTNNGGDENPSGSDTADNANTDGQSPTNAAGFVDSSVALSAYSTPADPANTLNNIADPSANGYRFVYDESGRIAKCYYQSNGQEVYLVYQYKETWVEIYGFIGETLVANEFIQLNGEFNPDVGFSQVKGYYLKGYIF